ncbi:MAG TPA: radical SAM protein [Bacteroidetes bacterium]|nr:radical SAM protein [Bacteroidota bacterium]
MSIVFGPIPSRRLGRSLGINNIPPKVCSYSCVYCQIGATDLMSMTRKEFYPPYDIVAEISAVVQQLHEAGKQIDYLTFVPDGEPTLDIHLGKEIEMLKPLGKPIAVITNSSLLWDDGVRAEIMKADWVSVKIDTVDESIWHRIDRPNRKLHLTKILEGIKAFADSFRGTIVTETMLVKGINDTNESISRTAEIITAIHPAVSYISVPTRPPAERTVEPPSEEVLNGAYQIFHSMIPNVELLVYNEGTDFTYSSDAERELLNILAVHPMRREAVELFLSKADAHWGMIERLIDNHVLKEIHYSGNSHIVKVLTSHS